MPIRDQIRTLLDTLVSPTAGYAYLAEFPASTWALVFYMLLLSIATALQQPASDHMTTVTMMRAAAKSGFFGTAQHTPLLFAIGSTIGGALISLVAVAAVYSVASAIWGKGWDFERAWSLAVNSSVIVGITALVNGSIVFLRGTDAANSFVDLFGIPAIGDFFHDPVLRVALSPYNPINIWYYVEVVIGLSIVLGVPKRKGALTVGLISLCTCGFYFVVAHFATMLG